MTSSITIDFTASGHSSKKAKRRESDLSPQEIYQRSLVTSAAAKMKERLAKESAEAAFNHWADCIKVIRGKKQALDDAILGKLPDLQEATEPENAPIHAFTTPWVHQANQ